MVASSSLSAGHLCIAEEAMEAQRIVFTGPNQAQLQEFELD